MKAVIRVNPVMQRIVKDTLKERQVGFLNNLSLFNDEQFLEFNVKKSDLQKIKSEIIDKQQFKMF